MSKLKEEFKVSDKGECVYGLGMEVIQSKDGKKIQLSHHRYVIDLYDKYKNDIETLILCVSLTPETPQLPPACTENLTKFQVKWFQGIIGSLMHPCVTDWPDITHAVGVLSQYLIVPRDEHYLRALKVIKYLYRTWEWCLTFDATNTDHKVSDSVKLTTYVDANWGKMTLKHADLKQVSSSSLPMALLSIQASSNSV